MFAGVSDHRDVAALIRARLAQDLGLRRPGHRASHRLASIMVVVRVRDQDQVGADAGREIVSEPDATGVRINQNLLAGR